MSEYDSKEITKLLGILIGGTEPIGETNYDLKVMRNLKKLIDVTNWCLDGMSFARDYIHSYEGSMHDVGFTAQCALQEWKEWIGEVLDE